MAGSRKTLAFIQRQGRRDEAGACLPYWSGYRAAGTKQTTQCKDANPAVDAAVSYSGVP
jgi:hypothetical protein